MKKSLLAALAASLLLMPSLPFEAPAYAEGERPGRFFMWLRMEAIPTLGR